MKAELVAKMWISRGLVDLYFGFSTEDWSFRDHGRFFEIMGLEKFLKAVYLVSHKDEYEGLPEAEALECLDKIGRRLGHNVKNLVRLVRNDLGAQAVEAIKATDFDGYLGRDLVRAVNAGYEETRYPVPNPISKTFPIQGTDLTWDPLVSSGCTKFIYAVCNLSYEYVSSRIDLSDVIDDFKKRFEHQESFRRFNNVFWRSTAGVSF